MQTLAPVCALVETLYKRSMPALDSPLALLRAAE